MTPPVRVCCGQPHDDVVCPDGLVMCCLCFRRVTPAELNEPTPGAPEDVCQPCAHIERLGVLLRAALPFVETDETGEILAEGMSRATYDDLVMRIRAATK